MDYENLELQVGVDWAQLLSPFMVGTPEVPARYDKIGTFLKTEKDNGRVFFPKGTDVFKAFRATPLADVRVILLAQDPYPKAGFANGLAFATDSKTPPVSLKVIYDALEEPKLQLERRQDGQFDWYSQGVLMLNSALTVEEGKPGSHADVWAPFTEFLIDALNKVKRDLIYIAVGAPAKKFTEKVNPFRNFVYTCEHPANAARKMRKWEHNNVFIQTNFAIRLNKLGTEINW